MKTMQELIENSLILGNETGSGFRPIKCSCCNDHSPRAGFKFEDGAVVFKCFNCKRIFVYVEGDATISNNAKSILVAFGINRSSVEELVAGNFFDNGGEITLHHVKHAKEINLNLEPISLPKGSIPLGNDSHVEYQKPIIEYLESRLIDYKKINAHFNLSEKFINRFIIPCKTNNKVIHWQARTIIPDCKPRYLTAFDNKAKALWGMDNIWKYSGPLFITEGFSDAYFVNGVALLGSDLTEEKFQILSNNRRRKVVVVDYDKNGKILANTALQHNWEITFPPKNLDINKSVIQNGRLFTFKNLIDNITSPNKSDILSMDVNLSMGMKFLEAELTRGFKK